MGVQFLFAKAPVCKDFSIPFNESRLYGNFGIVTVEPVVFYPSAQFNERSVGCAFWVRYVYFGERYVHLLTIPLQEKSRSSYAPALISVPL